MISSRLINWTPALIIAFTIAGTGYVNSQQRMPLRTSLVSTIPTEIEGYAGKDLLLTRDVEGAVGVSSYLMRNYRSTGAKTDDGFSIYVGYYERQGRGETIHSPKNCLPGNGWEPLRSSRIAIQTSDGEVTVNRYLLQRGRQRVVVLYWYQGRGRVEANEYLVKRDLLRDAAIRRRSEEALVRVTVPIFGAEANADLLAQRVASQLIPAATRALPL